MTLTKTASERYCFATVTARDAEELDGVANTKLINAAFRNRYVWSWVDHSMCARAIKTTRKLMRDCGMTCEGLEYALALEAEIARRINA
jgi:hypothetical protein